MTEERLLRNARLVLPEEVVTGDLLIRGETIAAVEPGRPKAKGGLPAGGEDLDGDYLIPGLIELHTDNLEVHLTPRPGVAWPTLPALMAHDAAMVSAGITTVLDALRIGDHSAEISRTERLRDTIDTLTAARERGLLRADHQIHLRCEMAAEHVGRQFEIFCREPLLRLVSLMDHTPGQRQFIDVETYKAYYKGRYKVDDATIDRQIGEQQANHRRYAQTNRLQLAEACRELGLNMASHDDATEAHVEEAVALGFSISEFPTSKEAAGAARRHGLTTVAGAPNVVRGGSHSGNVAALDLAEADLLDCLSSDYAPVSLLHGAFLLAEQLERPLPEALATVTANPADMVGLEDRGRLDPGLRADLIRVSLHDGLPVVRGVWRAGTRVA